MVIYIVTFLLSVFLFAISGNVKGKNERKILIALGILIPSIIAGVRDYTIGTDIYTYGNTWFNYAVGFQNYFKYVQYAAWSSIGVGYATLNFIVSRFTSNAHWFYFVLNLIANILVYRGLEKNKDICNVPLGMAVYYCVFWGIFLNALRQSIALAIIFWGYNYLRNNKPIKYFGTAILAILFHSTAIVALPAYFVHVVINGKNRFAIRCTVVVMSGIAISFFWTIVDFLWKNGLLSSRYGEYLSRNAVGGGTLIRFALYGSICMLLYFIVKKSASSYELNDFRIFSIYSVFLSLLAFNDAQSVRIAHYYDMYIIYAVGFLLNHSKIKGNSKKLYFYVLLFAFLIYWVFVFGYRQSDQIVPYIFMRN